MPGSRSVAFVALVFACSVAAACSDDVAAPGAPSTTAVAPSTSVTVAPISTSTSTTPSTSTTTVPGDPVPARIGEDVTFEVFVAEGALGPGVSLANVFREGTRLVVWVHTAAAAAGTEVSAQFGEAEVAVVGENGVRFLVEGRVPPELWERAEDLRPAQRVPAAPGPHRVTLQGFFSQPLAVDAGAPVSPTTTTRPAPVPSGVQVLGADDLAGVAFGTVEADALASLRARFGEPDHDEVRRSTCGEERHVAWGALFVVFRTIGSGSTASSSSTVSSSSTGRVFAEYVYSAPHAGIAAGPTDLRTTSGVGAGSSLAELLAREPDVVFTAESSGYALTSWYTAADSRLGGRLNDDITAAEVTVVEISASLDAAC